MEKEYTFFYNFERWEALFKALLQERRQDEEQSDSYVDKIRRILLDEKKDLNANDIYLILEEINSFLIDLELKGDFPSEIIMQLAKKWNLKKDLIMALVEKQEANKSTEEIRRWLQEPQRYYFSYLPKHKKKFTYLTNFTTARKCIMKSF